MDIEADLQGIASLMRRHIEIRNRSWMKRIHRDCFIGSEAVDFLVMQGFADSRKAAVEIGIKMTNKKIIRNITDSRKFSDSLHYYRYFEDDQLSASLNKTNAGHSPGSICLGHGGCKFSFAPHTVHNSFILDIALAEEVERAVAGASVEARSLAIFKLRSRVKEQAEVDAPNWDLNQTISVNGTQISVFTRTRPRGDWKNIKMTGIVAESPVNFVRSILSFERRRQWESAFEDGVIIEAIDTGEKPTVLINDSTAAPPSHDSAQAKPAQPLSEVVLKGQSTPSRPVARATDDVYSFLATVDLAGVPQGMAIAFLNDPERQYALSHLRKQMMLSQPQECMLCGNPFNDDGSDIRFCPCCAMVSCPGCVSKRVFEVVSRSITSVCVHCYRESSRIFQPPQAVQDETVIDQALRGKWWRPEELGLADYSNSSAGRKGGRDSISRPGGFNLYNDQDVLELTAANAATIKPLIPGLLDDILASAIVKEDGSVATSSSAVTVSKRDTSTGVDDGHDNVSEGEEEDDDDEEEEEEEDEAPTTSVPQIALESASASAFAAAPPSAPAAERTASMVANPKFARCKGCGLMISRDIEAIEAHMEECSRSLTSISGPSRLSVATSDPLLNPPANASNTGTYVISPEGAVVYTPHSTPKTFALFPRRPDLATKHASRIIYRTARTSLATLNSGSGRASVDASPAVINEQRQPREVCALQDSFIDEHTGTCYAYEISVRHSDVRGIGSGSVNTGGGYITADVMCLIYVARPIKQGKDQGSAITIISQIDTRERSSKWAAIELSGYLGNLGSRVGGGKSDISGVRKQDLVRELRACKDLRNLLEEDDDENESASALDPDGQIMGADGKKIKGVSLEDFELLAVLGRGGFGKVMQVRHTATQEIYAMKILKKSELRRRRQVERTQTERNILANVRHPFIVCLHYAFQNSQKLYMVMDFVQGGDFFTLMRKFRRLPEDWVKLYVMEVALALQHLHDREIVYRDLKPENILLCRDGHLKLTDFGLSRYFETRPPAPEDIVDGKEQDYVTRSFCGTEQYMSPEMLLQQGHNYRMDWWCLGLLMHEMITGKHPFHGSTHYDTLRNMVTKPPSLDARLSPGAAGLIRALLVKNPRARLGGREGVSELQHVAYLCVPSAPVTWDQLMQKEIEMPYKPKLVDDADISSFETTFTKEKPVDSLADGGGEDGDKDGKKKKKKNGGGGGGVFSSIFGSSNAANKKNGQSSKAAAQDDAFKDFSFAKSETVDQLSTTTAAVNLDCR
jgi:serine/threonine protein kinase